jgi:hypothetical protein
MPLPLHSSEIQEIYGILAAVLNRRSVADMRVIAGAGGWDRGQIPDGLDETGQFARKPPIVSAIDGQWAGWNEETKAKRVRGLAQALINHLEPKGMADEVNNNLVHCGFKFLNGDFVPVDATGQISS